MSNEIYKKALAFRVLAVELREYKEKAFPLGSIVYVEAPRYTGYGLASANSDCPADHVPVRLENGNTWWYPIEGVRRVEDFKMIPRFIRRLKLEFHGILSLKFSTGPSAGFVAVAARTQE